MRIIVVGGDGFCGWPTSLHLSSLGHEILILDNMSRRKIDVELEVESLTPIRPMSVRLEAWLALSSREIHYTECDVAQEYQRLVGLLHDFQPSAIVHFGEQRSAPYSMKSAKTKRYTMRNNVNATHNLLVAVLESGIDAHIVHLGSMGVYGYGGPDVRLPEGYLPVRLQSQSGDWVEQNVLYPVNPGSVYHLTKTIDQSMFAYYNKNDGLRVTDLHQGIVWGTQTRETLRDERLINRFDYDGDYGTVLNRFLVQAATGHPLTVHDIGRQTRAFIHLRDSVRCIELAIESPPALGHRVRILNQMTEVHRIIDLAELVSELTGASIQHYRNPRREAAENELLVDNSGLIALGLVPLTLADNLLAEVVDVAERYAARCDLKRIPCTSEWTPERS